MPCFLLIVPTRLSQTSPLLWLIFKPPLLLVLMVTFASYLSISYTQYSLTLQKSMGLPKLILNPYFYKKEFSHTQMQRRKKISLYQEMTQACVLLRVLHSHWPGLPDNVRAPQMYLRGEKSFVWRDVIFTTLSTQKYL